MIKKVYISQTNCITPLGLDVLSNVEAIDKGVTAIQLHQNKAFLPTDFHAAFINETIVNQAFLKLSDSDCYTKLEKMLLLALAPIIKSSTIELNSKIGFILSTTKGNITALQNPTSKSIEQAQLHTLAKSIASFFGFVTEPIVVSNACVSGILAVSVAKRMIQSTLFDAVFIVAGDEVSPFVLSGFNSFQAMSNAPCKPYSKNRSGVNLGEAAAAVLITNNPENAFVEIIGDGSINDANHISGPSRTGEGLVKSIESALSEAKVSPEQIDFISAHGTATPFNDEMEAIALNRLALQNVPINSLKGYFGHTLGASGLLETVIGIHAIQHNILMASLGFDEIGVSQNINVIAENTHKECTYFLKTASGFGGCNTAVLFKKHFKYCEKFF